MKPRLLWIDVGFACGGVEVSDEGVIVKAPPILQKFVGQPYERLTNWRKTVTWIWIAERDHP